jgi:colanic acid/amylovoran biosynthesis glycosyltransferase
VRRLAYLFPAFPVLHQTFTLGEVIGLKHKGYDLRLISLKPSLRNLQQPEAEPLIAETLYCPRLASKAMIASFSRALRSRPADVLGLFGAVISAWRTGAPGADAHDDAPAPTTLSFGERLLAIYHHNRYVYLAKSLILVPYAIFVAEALEREGIGHVHAHWATYPTTVALLVKRWAGIPYSFTAHAYDIYMIDRMLPAKIENATFVVTCADTNRRYLASLCANGAAHRIHVNYHGTDLGRFSPATRTRDDRYHVMSCGWLKEYKGFHILLDALALLVERGIDATLDLAGDGPQRAYLEKKAADLGIRDRVTFHGYIGHGQLVELYRRADVFALPSIVMGKYGRQDVIPNVLAEAMATGLPAVGSRIAGIPELIEHGVNGLTVPERDPEALADALERLWRDPETAARLGAGGRRKVEQIWNRTTNLEELAGLIDAHVGKDRSGTAVEREDEIAAARFEAHAAGERL